VARKDKSLAPNTKHATAPRPRWTLQIDESVTPAELQLDRSQTQGHRGLTQHHAACGPHESRHADNNGANTMTTVTTVFAFLMWFVVNYFVFYIIIPTVIDLIVELLKMWKGGEKNDDHQNCPL
jgi:hypothetical protein